MNLEDQELEVLLRSTVEQDPSSEVDFATLMELRAGLLEGEAAEKARRALVAFPELAQAVLDVDRLEELEQMAAGVDPDREETAWQRFVNATSSASETAGSEADSQELPSVSPGPREVEPIAELKGFRGVLARYPFSSMAASMVLASGLTFLLLQGGASDVSGNLGYESLSLIADAGPKRSSGSQAQTLVVLQGVTAVILELNPPPRLELDFDLPTLAEAVLAQGETASEPIPTRLHDEGVYLLWIPATELISGTLRIQLQDPAGSKVFAEYSLDVFFEELP